MVRFDDDSVSIEHVYPQNPSDDWDLDESKMQRFVFRLGNMCLLEKGLNRDLQNAGFAEKVAVYQGSSFYYARKIATEFTDWSESAIVNLQAELANAAVSIWRVNV